MDEIKSLLDQQIMINKQIHRKFIEARKNELNIETEAPRRVKRQEPRKKPMTGNSK